MQSCINSFGIQAIVLRVDTQATHILERDSATVVSFTTRFMDAAQQDSDPQAVLNFAMSSVSNLIDNKLENFARTMSQHSGSIVDEAVRRAKRETFVCKSKGNQQQLEHCLKVLEKLEDATTLLDNNAVGSAKRKLEEGTDIIQKRIKAIEIADKSDYGWATVSEYLSDELASDTEDEKRLYRSEKRAEKK